MIRDYKTFNLFPIPVGRVVTAMPDDEITKFTCEFLTENELGYTTFHNPDKNKIYQRDMPSSSKFVEMVTDAANTFMDNWGIKTNRTPHVYFWGSHCQRGDNHHSHVHPMSTLSGTYWSAAEDRASPLVFENPAGSSMMQYPPRQEHYEYSHKPKTGDMLIWPSWLQHKVLTQMSDAMRVAISFNVVYKF